MHGAFLPNNGEVSLFRIEGWSVSEIWNEWLEVGKYRDPSLKGRGDFIWGNLDPISVKLYPDPHPSKHVNIKDFPVKREEIQEQAIILARACLFKKFIPEI